MALEIFRLMGGIYVDNDKANESIAKTDKKAQGVGKTLLKGVGTAAKWGAGLMAGAGAGLAALSGVAKKAADAADNIDKMSQKIGISKTAYQELDFVMSQSGASVDSLKTGMKTLTDQMSMAQDGSETATKAFEDLGVSWEDGNGQLKDQETMMFDAMKALQDMEDQTKKAALASDLFGKAGTEMMPMLNGASGSIESMRQQAHDLGLVLSDETINSGVVFTDTMDQSKRMLSAMAVSVGAELIPMIQRLLEWVQANMPTIQAVTQTAFSAISIAIGIVSDAIGFVIENSNILIPVLGGVLAAFIALKTISVISGLMAVWKASTMAATLAQGGLNAVLSANPIGLVVIAIGLLVAAGIALYKNWDTVKEFLGATWDWIKTTAMSVFNSLTDFFGGFSDKVKNIFGGVKDIITGIWDGITSGVKSSINFILKGINTFIRGINKIQIPDWVPAVGGKGFHISEIPMLAKGGTIRQSGSAIVGEAGPELLNLPTGAKVTPLDKAESQDMSKTEQLLSQILNALQKGASIYIDGKKVAKATAQDMSKELASLNKNGARRVGVMTV